MGTPGVQQSPWLWDSGPDYQGNLLAVSVTFNNSTRALNSATITVDPGCVYTKLYFGTGPDGTPNSAPGTFDTKGAARTSISKAQLKAGGFNTIEDVLALQITAGP